MHDMHGFILIWALFFALKALHQFPFASNFAKITGSQLLIVNLLTVAPRPHRPLSTIALAKVDSGQGKTWHNRKRKKLIQAPIV